MSRVRDNRQLSALLAAAAAPPFTQSEQDLVPVLAAFRAAADGVVHSRTARGDGAGVRPRRMMTGRLSVTCAAVCLLTVGGGVAVANAGVLPGPVQQFAHDVFGAPAPGGPGAPLVVGSTASAPVAGTPTASGAVPPSPAASSATVAVLCERVARGGKNWRKELTGAERVSLAAAAGGEGKVVSYCAHVMAGSAQATATDTAWTSVGSGSASASPDASATHGVGRATHSPSPNPHASGH